MSDRSACIESTGALKAALAQLLGLCLIVLVPFHWSSKLYPYSLGLFPCPSVRFRVRNGEFKRGTSVVTCCSRV